MLLGGLLPYVGYSTEDLLHAMEGIVPSLLAPLLHRFFQDLEQGSSGTLISLTALTAVWSGSRGVYCIQQGLNAICKVRESRSYLYRRAISMLYTLLLLAAFVLTLVMQGFGGRIAAFLETKPVPLLQFIVTVLEFRELIIFLFLTLLFSAIFCVLPNKKLSFLAALPGAALAALGWLLFTYGFSIYARFSGSYSLFYGSLSVIALGMFWLFVCICILFYGCVFNLRLAKNCHGPSFP